MYSLRLARVGSVAAIAAVMALAGCPRRSGAPGDAGSADQVVTDTLPPAARYVVTTLAGNGTAGYVDGTGGASGTTEFNRPGTVAVDHAGNIYVVDVNNNRIRKIDPAGNTSTLAGNGAAGFVDGSGGPGGTTEFDHPFGVAVDSTGKVYVADSGNDRIRECAPDGTTTTLAGNGVLGWVDGTGGPSGTTEFDAPADVAADAAGDVYVSDMPVNRRVRKIDPSGNTTTFSGNGENGFMDGTGGPHGTASFGFLGGLEVAPSGAVPFGTVFVADDFDYRVRKLDVSGNTTTYSGNGVAGYHESSFPGDYAEYNQPLTLAIDTTGIVYVSDGQNLRIRRIALDRTTETIAGNGASGYVDGPGNVAEFEGASGLALDPTGKILYVADENENRVRKIAIP